jgi:mRNA-degrading endonuclease RelE of RelBE toxin-antitoxin system
MKTVSEQVPTIEIQLTPEFQAKFKALKKRYRNIQADIKPIFEQLENGLVLGDKLPGIDALVVKLRVKNSDTKRGKSGGYRLIYWIASPKLIIMLDVYSKSDQENVTANEVRQIIANFKKAQGEDKKDEI